MTQTKRPFAVISNPLTKGEIQANRPPVTVVPSLNVSLFDWLPAVQAAEASRIAEKRLTHPLYGMWPPSTKAELEKLVWMMSSVKLAKQFGISDSAIGKRCRTLGVSKPPTGFWNKVAAGLLPHPNGVPAEVLE